MHSGIYIGNIRHRRFTPRQYQFSYQLYMMAICLDELPTLLRTSKLFGIKWYTPLRFKENDYITSEPGTLKQRIIDKVEHLTKVQNALGNEPASTGTISRITMLTQCRCFGVYFSPANFYFCYDIDDKCIAMLAEVSNTPWNERHYYLVDISKPYQHKKTFTVSPFMTKDMFYHWRVKAPKKTAFVHIENRTPSTFNNDTTESSVKIFDATLALKRQEFTAKNVLKTWLAMPVMTIKIFLGIYWQAMKIFCKRIPFIGYGQKNRN